MPRRLPQGCQIEKPFTDEEWDQFLACATRGFEKGKGLAKEFYAKIEEHGVTDNEVRRAMRRSAKAVAYVHEGQGRVALWDSADDGLIVIARESDGLVFNAFPKDNVPRYVRAMQDPRWLRR